MLKLMDKSTMRKICLVSKYVPTRYFLSTKGKVIIVEKPGRHRSNQAVQTEDPGPSLRPHMMQ